MKAQALVSLLLIAISLYLMYERIKGLRGRVHFTVDACRKNIDFLRELFRGESDPWTDIREN